MARLHYWQYIVDEDGRPINEVEIRFYFASTETEASIYANPTVGHQTTTSAINLLSNGDGYFEFWVGDKWELNGGYENTQRFKVTWYKAGISQGEINDIDIFPPLYEVDETSAGQSPAAEAVRRNKLISNRLAYQWEGHVAEIVPSASPHGIEPVIVCDTDDNYNKVISNKLMNQIWTLAVSASTTSLDASGADIDFSEIPVDHTLVSSGGLWYADITHNLGNLYPILQVIDTTDFTFMVPENLQTLTTNSTRVWMATSAAQFMVTAIG